MAGKIALSQDGVTLESTIADKNIEMPQWDFDNPESIKAWEEASAAYANQVSGNVRAVIGSRLREGNIWENVELPRLMKNESVTRITTINPDTLEEVVIFERDASNNVSTVVNSTLKNSGQWNELMNYYKNDKDVESISILDSDGTKTKIYERG